MNRFYVVPENISGGFIRITDSDDIRHFVKVLRIREGEDVFISDGEGAGYIAQLYEIFKSEVLLKIKVVIKKSIRDEQKIKITLACAVPKNTDFEDVVDKATQLGVDEIIPLFTERVLVKKEVFLEKKARFKRIIIAAAKQSGVLFLPKLNEPVNFNDFIKSAERYDLALLPNLSDRPGGHGLASFSQSHKPLSLKDAVGNFLAGKILILIGPEGDFTKEEIDLAFEAGCKGVSLGDNVLRVDTAAISVISFLKLYFNI